MKLIVKATSLEITPALNDYLVNKLSSLSKFVRRWETAGEIEVRIELGRTTRHHRRGNIYRAEVDLCLPEKLLRAEASEPDIRMAVDRVKDKLQQGIKKYKELRR